MGTILVFDSNYKWDKEYEVFFSQEFGANCLLTFKDGSKQLRSNCTELHHNFKEGVSAFESDIHSTGGTVELKNLTSIVVTVAKEKAVQYRL